MPHHNNNADKIHHFNPYNAQTPLKIMDEFYKTRVFGGGSLGKSFQILKTAKDNGAKIFFSMAGAMVPGGMREVIVAGIKSGLLDVIVTTGANVTHDLIESFGNPHLTGVDYKNDQELRDRGIDRVYDSFVHQDGFPNLEDNLQELIMEFFNENKVDDRLITSSNELISWLGSKIKDENSIVKVAFDHGVPVYVPALSDSVLGLQIWLKSQFHKIHIDEMRDLTSIQDLYHESSKAAAFMVGGGVPKNYTLQASLLSPRDYQYGVAVTMDRVETGGLSGATLEEAVSWGKITWDAPKVTVYADVTIVLPLLVASWIEYQQS